MLASCRSGDSRWGRAPMAQLHRRSEISIPKHAGGMTRRRSTPVDRQLLRLSRWLEARRRDRADNRARLADQLDAYLDLMAGLEADKKASAKALSDRAGDLGAARDRRQAG